MNSLPLRFYLLQYEFRLPYIYSPKCIKRFYYSNVLNANPDIGWKKAEKNRKEKRGKDDEGG